MREPFCLKVEPGLGVAVAVATKGQQPSITQPPQDEAAHAPSLGASYTVISASRITHHKTNNCPWPADGLLHEPRRPRKLFTQPPDDMPKSTPRPDFTFHVDPSCLTDSTDLAMPAERVPSSQTVVHHDSWDELEAGEKEAQAEAEDTSQHKQVDNNTNELTIYDEEQKARDRQIDRIEAQIQAAARAVVASFEDGSYHGEDSVLSARTDESYNAEHSLLGYEEGSALSTQTYETYDHENPRLSYDPENSQLTYAGSEGAYETEDEEEQHPDEAGDSSSHHDGDIEDDVFSPSENSGRSSMNSCHDTSDEANNKELTSPVVGEEAGEPISRIPSAASYTPMQTPHTPTKGMSRPTFRNPSSVRAMQMSSPPPSIFSPRSSKRHIPTGSRMSTPSSRTSFSPSKRTPTRFKKKQEPLVLLHVTVLPLTWSHARAISSQDVPASLQGVKENYRLLHEKLGDTVLERGILLPHPQDSYEVLEERLLEALELPVHPRARILKCGHYMGPETPSSDEEGTALDTQIRDRKWCDICEREVKIEGSGMDGKAETRFRVKVYASNGLMRAGAWAAAWREMERVDVELEPYVESRLVGELEDFAASVAHLPDPVHGDEEDAFVDEDETGKVEHHHTSPETTVHPDEERRAQEEEVLRRQQMEEERLREVYGHGHPRAESRMSSSHQAPHQTPNQAHPPIPTARVEHGDSLAELLLAAFKVAMRDRRNVLICVLSALVLLLALKPGTGQTPHLDPVVRDSVLDVTGIVAEPVTVASPATTYLSTEIENQVTVETQSEVQLELEVPQLHATPDVEKDVRLEATIETPVPAKAAPEEHVSDEETPSELQSSDLSDENLSSPSGIDLDDSTQSPNIIDFSAGDES